MMLPLYKTLRESVPGDWVVPAWTSQDNTREANIS